jgi:preprotein translocase subunit SecE
VDNMNRDGMKLNNIALWVMMALATVAAVFVTTFFHFSAPIMALVWIGWLITVLAIGYFTAQGQVLLTFASESKNELQKVVWPTRQETIQTTSIVMIMVTVTGFILWGIDTGMMWAIGKITHLG